MNQAKASHPKRNTREGFTLVELLIVIAIIALLVALLLPTLARAKDSARSASCKNNLRQLGMALEMYVTDYEKYPGNGAIYSGGGLTSFRTTGMKWLNQCVGGSYDPGSPNSNLSYAGSGSLLVFRCPARKPFYMPGLFGGSGTYSYPLGYGYNELGTGWESDTLHLGLGFRVKSIAVSGQDLWADVLRYTSPGDIRVPSSMIGIADSEGTGWITPNYPGYGGSSLTGPHANTRANVLFCDGHIENAKAGKWNDLKESSSGWNNDNLPHPETWQ